MTIDGLKLSEEYTSGGEIEIERISTSIIEARSKSLIPVCDFAQAQQAR